LLLVVVVAVEVLILAGVAVRGVLEQAQAWLLFRGHRTQLLWVVVVQVALGRELTVLMELILQLAHPLLLRQLAVGAVVAPVRELMVVQAVGAVL
jgi:hypothetical protein